MNYLDHNHYETWETDINLLELYRPDSKKTTKNYALKLGFVYTAYFMSVKKR